MLSLDMIGQIVLASFAALLAVVTFTIGQFIEKIIINPVQEQKKLIGEIATALSFYANVYDFNHPKLGPLTPQEKLDKTQLEIRSLASRLKGSFYITRYPSWVVNFLCEHGLLLTEERMKNAYSPLIGWSNSLGFDVETRKSRHIFMDNIEKALNIEHW